MTNRTATGAIAPVTGLERCRAWLWATGALVLVVAAGAKPAGDDFPRRGTTVALVDLQTVFEQHPGFLRRVHQLKEAVETTEAAIRGKRQEIEAIQQRLAKESMPKAQREQLESQVRESTQSLSLEITLAKKVFTQREAAIYASIYQDVCRVVREYMHEHGIDVVIRLTHQGSSDLTKDVQKRLNAPIVAFSDRLDITAAIVRRCASRDEQLLADEPVEAPQAE